MTQARDFAVLDATLVDPAAGREGRGSLLVRDGTIADIVWGAAPVPADGVETIDGRGLVLAPGLVDLRAFLGEPGAEFRETLGTGSHAAAAGGVTTVICRADTSPPIDDPAVIDFLKRRARDKAVVNVLPAACLTKGLHGKEITEFGMLLEAGAVAFSDGAAAVRNPQVMRRAMIYARDFDALVMNHVEDADLRGVGVMNEGEFASRKGLPGIPVEAETIMLERDLRLARATGARYHAEMISCSDSLDLIRRAKADGLAVTCGVSINNLTLNEIDVGEYRTFCKLSPPLRTEEERLAMVAAVAEGLIDVIVSDHDPQDVETKRQPFADAANGALGIETLLPAALRLFHAGQVGLPALLSALSARPARLLGLDAGRLERGQPADLMLLDPDAPFVVDKMTLKSRAKNSPFDQARLQGIVQATWVGGGLAYRAEAA
ncbi:dihydroorotase [Bosea sp. TWI1241]|uniref:dihydroorotase n=1 Tax=Bosea sp. TWI1241 TaxID=3148904 RepID=UPI0032094622